MSNWEKALLGTVLNDPAVWHTMEHLLPSDFTGPQQLAFAEIASLASRNAIDARALTEALRSSPDYERFSDTGTPDEFVAELVFYRGAEPEEYVRRVLDAAIKRSLKRNAALIAAEADNDQKTAAEVVDFAESKLLNMRRNRDFEVRSFKDILTTFMPRVEGIRNGTFVPAWAPDVLAMRDVILFAEPTESICIAARPGSGKSSYVRYEFFKAATNNKSVGIVNLENDENDYARGYLALATGIDSKKLKDPRLLSRWELEQVKEWARNLANLPIYIKSMSSPSAAQVRTTIRRMVAEHNITMVAIDYLQLMNNAREKKNDDVSISSQQMRASAMELHIPHFDVSQMNRAVELRSEGAEPQLSDLRDSGCIAGETLIVQSDGTRKPIRDLVGENVPVMALNPTTMKIEKAVAQKVWKTGEKQVFRMTTSLGKEIKATDNHQFLTVAGWKRLDEIQKGERIALPRKVDSSISGELTHDQAALLGHMIGDGCTIPYHVLQYTTVEIELAEMVASLAKKVFGDEVVARISKERNWYQVYISARTLVRERNKGIRSNIRKWFDSQGVYGLRAWEKKVPESVFSSTDDILKTFLSHLWATDGSIGIVGKKKLRPVAYYATSSRELADGVSFLLLRLGILSRVQLGSNRGRGIWHVTITGKPDILRFCQDVGSVGNKGIQANVVLDYVLNHNAVPNRDVIPCEVWKTIIFPRMRKLGLSGREFHVLMGWAYAGTYRSTLNLSRETARKIAGVIRSKELAALAKSDVIWDEVVDIQAEGIEEVYDAEVPDYHNFIAGEIVVHNSLEQDHTIIAFLHGQWSNPNQQQLRQFPENIAPDNTLFARPKAVPIKFIVAKNRNGEAGPSEVVKWIKSTGNFQTLVRGETE